MGNRAVTRTLAFGNGKGKTRMNLSKLLLSFCFVVFVFTCSAPQSPFSQDKAKVYLHLESSTNISSDSTITDTTGNTVRIGITFFMPQYFDSVVITVGKSITTLDTFFVCKKADIKNDAAWFSCAFTSAGTRTVTATGCVEGGYRPTASGKVTIVARPVNHKPTLVITGRRVITTMEACTLFVSANDSDTAQAHSFHVGKGPQGYTFASQIFSWKPASVADTGTDTVVFTVVDGGVPPLSDTQMVYISVLSKLSPPSPVDSLRLTALKNGVAGLGWHAVSNADSFLVFRSTNRAATYILRGSTNQTTFKDSILAIDYYYFIQARNLAGVSYSDTIYTGDFAFLDTIKPFCTDSVAPVDGTDSVEYLNGVTLKWTPPAGVFKDTLHYVLFYASDTGSFTSISTKSDSVSLVGLQGSKTYRWFVLFMAAHDTTRCPVDTASFHTFTTRNHPSIIKTFTDIKATINDTINFNVTATDPEGVKEFQWDFNNDGVVDKTTSTGSVTYTVPSTPGTYKVTVYVIDSTGKSTSASATITVTNNIPTISLTAPDTVGLHALIALHADVKDDGKIVSYEWKFNDQPYNATKGPDTSFFSPSENLPSNIQIILRVRDDEVSDTVTIHAAMKWHKVNESSIFAQDAQLVYFSKKLWLYNGGKGGDTSEIWSSNDSGKTWVSQSNSQRFGICDSFSLIALPNKIVKTNSFIVSGQTSMFLKDVWSSVDGIKWHADTLRAQYPTYNPPPAPCLFSYQNKVYQLDYGTNAIWAADTSNTVKWDSVADLSSLNRQNYSIVPFQNKYFLLGGTVNLVPQIDVLESSNLAIWATQTSSAGFPRSASFHCTVFGDKLWVIAGDASGQSAFYSSDGINWKTASAQIPSPFQLTVSDDGNCLWILGDGVLWYSTDAP
jgi:hypothetical protein